MRAVDLVERGAEGRDLALHHFELLFLVRDLRFIGFNEVLRLCARVVHDLLRPRVRVGYDRLRLGLGLAQRSVAEALGTEDRILDSVLVGAVRLDFLRQNRKLFLQLRILSRKLADARAIVRRARLCLCIFLCKRGDRFQHFVDKLIYVIRIVSGKIRFSEADFLNVLDR